ncbi:nuclear transport factor 2 family protein [Flavisphingomonas formosensis]|uniref:nuclear transport factor 2 family protein n=1 Tax=Flavisphingomonas formosensis TaxID=861534 RepID=UPI0012F8604C|nr:nuclear transport factor 2 family protein [Sphingomonas formosensis]
MTDEGRLWRGPIAPPGTVELADRYAVGQLCQVYALAMDLRDLDMLLSCFDPNGIGSGTAGSGPLHDYLRRTFESAAGYKATQHTILNQYATIDRDQAVCLSYGVAYHIQQDPAVPNLTVGVRYRDLCSRTARGWIIVDRAAAVQWAEGPMPQKKN